MQYTFMDLVGYLNFLKQGTPVVGLNELIQIAQPAPYLQPW
jgi:hypothetical protein